MSSSRVSPSKRGRCELESDDDDDLPEIVRYTEEELKRRRRLVQFPFCIPRKLVPYFGLLDAMMDEEDADADADEILTFKVMPLSYVSEWIVTELVNHARGLASLMDVPSTRMLHRTPALVVLMMKTFGRTVMVGRSSCLIIELARYLQYNGLPLLEEEATQRRARRCKGHYGADDPSVVVLRNIIGSIHNASDEAKEMAKEMTMEIVERSVCPRVLAADGIDMFDRAAIIASLELDAAQTNRLMRVLQVDELAMIDAARDSLLAHLPPDAMSIRRFIYMFADNHLANAPWADTAFWADGNTVTQLKVANSHSLRGAVLRRLPREVPIPLDIVVRCIRAHVTSDDSEIEECVCVLFERFEAAHLDWPRIMRDGTGSFTFLRELMKFAQRTQRSDAWASLVCSVCSNVFQHPGEVPLETTLRMRDTDNQAALARFRRMITEPMDEETKHSLSRFQPFHFFNISTGRVPCGELADELVLGIRYIIGMMSPGRRARILFNELQCRMSDKTWSAAFAHGITPFKDGHEARKCIRRRELPPQDLYLRLAVTACLGSGKRKTFARMLSDPETVEMCRFVRDGKEWAYPTF